MKITCLTVFVCLVGSLLLGQNDSITLLSPYILADSFIIKYPPTAAENIFVSATRTAESPHDLPFSTFTITSDEILRNGYVTLVDVLKAAPGIRVSQPGNAIEGEKFLLNGMVGNRYLKILINDVPVKPTVQLGMPIAEQLPIRQAERIEIYYGSASVVYGGDACVGVVNIILKQSERPVFTQADLSFGTLGYNNLDLMFGGKVGKDKKIFRFSLFGSSTVREDLNLDFSQVNKMDDYLLFGETKRVFLQNPNFRGMLNANNQSQALIGQLSQDSRMFGLQLKWRGIDFMYLRTARSTQTAMGFNPLSYSYTNPSNRLTEKSSIYSASFRAGKRWFRSQNILSLINYKLENFSTATLVYDSPIATYFNAIQTDPSSWEKQYNAIFKRFLSDERYLFSNGVDLRHELRTNFRLGKKYDLDAGWQANIGGGIPMLNYLKAPKQSTSIFREGGGSRASEPFNSFADGDFDINFFLQMHRRTKRLTLNIAAAANLSFFYEYDGVISYRAACRYKLSNEWAVFSNVATGFKRPSFFSQTQSYRIIGDSLIFANSNILQTTERFRTSEIGLRYFNDHNTHFDLIFFQQTADYLMRNGYYIDSLRNTNYREFHYGFASALGRAAQLWGLRLTAVSKTADWDEQINYRTVKVFWRNEMFVQYLRGREAFDYGYQSLNEIINQPRWMFQFRTAMRIGKSELVTSVNRQSGSLSAAAFYTQFVPRARPAEDLPSFTTWDFTYRFHMSKHFLFYLQITNAFNRKYAGLDASGTADDLLFNPQQLRNFRFGANYNLN